MKRDNGILVILVGVGLLFISIFFSSGNFAKDGMSNMEMTLVKGGWVGYLWHNEGSVAVPLKYPLSLSVVLILVGAWIVLKCKNKKTDA